MRSNWFSESGVNFVPPLTLDYIRLRCQNPKCQLFFLTPFTDPDNYCWFCEHPTLNATPIHRQDLPEIYLYDLPVSSWAFTG